MGDKWFAVTWIQSVHSLTYTEPKPVTHTHTHTLATAVWLQNLWKSSLWWLLDLLFLSVEFHTLEINNELRQFLSLCKRQQSHAVWYGWNLFHDQKLLHCREDVTRWMYIVGYQNVAQYCGAYGPNGILTNFQMPNKYRNSLSVLQTQTAQIA